MGRCCAIFGCISGRKATKKNKNKVSLFKAPKFENERVEMMYTVETFNIDLLKKWSIAMNQELKQTSYVCEWHFDKHDVLKTNKEVLQDGSIYVYEYENVHLKKNAVPQLKKINVGNLGSNNMQSLTVPDISNINIILHLSGNSNSTATNISLKSSQNSTETIIPDKIDNAVVDYTTENLIKTENFTESFMSDDTNDIIIDEDILSVEINDSQEFSLDALEKVLETQPLRKYWSWTCYKNSFISFAFVNSKAEFECHVKIDMSLNVTITNAKTNLLINMDANISSIDSIWQLLSTLENCLFCSGTGCNDKRYSSSCTGILLPDGKYKKKMPVNRCVNCRKVRRVIQKRKIKSIAYKAEWMKAKHQLNLERRKLRRAILRNEKLKKKILHLKESMVRNRKRTICKS